MGWETQPLRILVARYRRFLIRAICVILLIRDSDNYRPAGAMLVDWFIDVGFRFRSTQSTRFPC